LAADYDAQSVVERELVLRLSSSLWRLRRAVALETGLFEAQAGRLDGSGQGGHPKAIAGDMLHAILAVRSSVNAHMVGHAMPSPRYARPRPSRDAFCVSPT
jgi:hypothetical protein